MNPPALHTRVATAIGQIFNRAAAAVANVTGGGKSAAELVRQSNKWRDSYNPLRSLVISRVVSMLEAAERGDYAELQLTLRKVEKRYPVLKALIARRTGAIEKLSWDVKVPETLPEGATAEMAEAQRKHLRACYDLVENLTDAFGQLALAEFRGFTILQKHRYQGGPNDGAVRELHWLPQFCWSRDGQFGDFYYNQDSRFGIGLGSCATVLGEKNRLPLREQPADEAQTPDAQPQTLERSDFVLRECDAPLYEIALIAFINWLMGRKDWAAFVEIFGIPNSVVIMPPLGTGQNADEYRASAEKVADGVSGALPNGSDVKFPTASVRGNAPFKEFCDAQDADLVLAGTGGLLTMLSLPTGIGGGASGEHGDAFADLALADARRITSTLQQDFDGPELAAAFPGQPHLAYFELAAEDEDDTNQLVTNVTALKGAGFVVKAEWLAERTGYELEAAQEVPAPGAPGTRPAVPGAPVSDPASTPDPILNRDTQPAGSQVATVLQDQIAPLRKRFAAIAKVSDPDTQRALLEKALADLPAVLEAIKADDSLARALGDQFAPAFQRGLSRPVQRVMNTDQARVPAGSPQGGQFVALEDEAWTGTHQEMRARATAVMEQFTPVQHPQLGTVSFPRKGIKKTVMSMQTPHEFQSAQAIPKVVEQGRLVSSRPDTEGRADIVRVHTIEHGVNIGSQGYRAHITVREHRDGQATAHKFYLHRLVKNRKPAVHVAYPALRPSRGPAGNANMQPGNAKVNP